jgi:hypothetical protein
LLRLLPQAGTEPLRAASTREKPQYPSKRPRRAATAASALGHNQALVLHKG